MLSTLLIDEQQHSSQQSISPLCRDLREPRCQRGHRSLQSAQDREGGGAPQGSPHAPLLSGKGPSQATDARESLHPGQSDDQWQPSRFLRRLSQAGLISTLYVATEPVLF